MSRRPAQDVTDTELAILQVIWKEGRATRRQITDALYPKGGEAHYATVQNLLGRLERKGFVRHTRADGVLVFTSRIDRDELIRRRLKGVADKLCGGAVAPLVMNLVRSRPLPADEIENLYAFLREQRKLSSGASPSERSRAVDDLFRLGLNNAAWAAALAIVAAAGARIWRNRPALAHALWLLVILKLATPSLVTLSVPNPAGLVPRRHVVEQRSAKANPPASASAAAPHPSRSTEHFVREPNASHPESNAEPAQISFADQYQSNAGLRRPWRTALALLWLSGAGLWWTCVAMSVTRFRLLLDSAGPAPAELQGRVSDLATRMGLGTRLIPTALLTSARVSPLVWASPFSRPRLLLPAELWRRLDPSQQDAVLTHELAHLKRRDHWVRWLEAVVLGIYWWNPVAWWARRELERTEEEACDAWVLSSQPKAASAYAETLVATTAFLSGVSLRLPPGASGVTNSLSLKRRLSMLLSHTANLPMARSRSWKMLVVGALCLPLLPAPSPGETAGPPAAAPPSQTQAKSEQVQPKPLPPAAPSTAPRIGRNQVRVVHPTKGRNGEYADVDGRLQSAVRVEIKAAVGGMLKSVAFRQFQRVKKGDVLFEIDTRSYALELQKALAEVKRLQSRLRNIGVQARAVDREKRADRENIARVQAEFEEAEAVLLGAQATLDLAKLKLDSTKVTAPIDGVVSKLMKSEGDFVEAEKTALAQMFATNLLTADFYVEEDVGQPIDQREPIARISLGILSAWQ